ncbi:hypothetical protein [Epilithonimonas arachidiradicis]|uniref:Uncharacterized protein n=1 Tax=Epilithonimonas arachidiradicis TaxID=1617282 RepID=A0A420CL97_9FLAO|nr:hypothetical protein [Epilithonimonas arachidiradicis]RKE79112.1 hypothetical protein BXY58_3374 [Epilithonimonas arachidiradicis]GGG60359.1 hypothetical protein GCM10007332_22500 [Epilithonimonas arachidiradicis]
MKKLHSIIGIFLSTAAFSQVIIGNATGTVPAGQKTSVLLEFAAGQNKGIILPYTRSIPAGAGLAEGTFILDTRDATKVKVKYYNGVTGMQSSDGWFDLSNGNTADISATMLLQPTNASVTEDAAAKVIIGAANTSADGVLVLESDSKAMVLPMVNSTDDVIDPAPGMMVYINKEGAKRLAVFNGNAWTFWKAS